MKVKKSINKGKNCFTSPDNFFSFPLYIQLFPGISFPPNLLQQTNLGKKGVEKKAADEGRGKKWPMEKMAEGKK